MNNINDVVLDEKQESACKALKSKKKIMDYWSSINDVRCQEGRGGLSSAAKWEFF